MSDMPPDDRKTLKAAWLASGRTQQDYTNATPSALSDYEIEKLRTGNVRVGNPATRNFLEKAKSLLGEASFAELCGAEAQRAIDIETCGKRNYPGHIPENPPANFIGLVLSRVGSLPRPILSTASDPAPVEAAPTSKPASARKTAAPLPQIPLQLGLATPPPPIELLPLGEKPDPRAFRRTYYPRRVMELGQSPDSGSMLWASTALVQLTLPHDDPKTDRFSRNNGRKFLAMVAGQRNGQKLGLPYGVRPRLLLHYIVTRVARGSGREIEFPGSLYALHKELGMACSSEKFAATAEMAERLFSCMITVGDLPKRETGASKLANRLALFSGVRDNYVFADHTELYWDSRRRDDLGGLFRSYIRLSENFYNIVKDRTFPVHRDAIRRLQQSSLNLDLYTWLCWRNHALLNAGNELASIPIVSTEMSTGLIDQFGANFKEAKAFTFRLKKALVAVREVWLGDLKCEILGDRLVLKPSTLQINKNGN